MFSESEKKSISAGGEGEPCAEVLFCLEGGKVS